MKPLTKIFAISLIALVALMAMVYLAIASSDQTQIFNISSTLISGPGSDKVTEFFAHYWPFIALVASELIVFVPIKANGLIHALIEIGNSLFAKK